MAGVGVGSHLTQVTGDTVGGARPWWVPMGQMGVGAFLGLGHLYLQS